jgi:hypothetical protein
MKTGFRFVWNLKNLEGRIMKSLLYFLLILTIVSCGENPVIIQKADKPTSTNISFTPNIINLSPLVNDYRIVFKGVDFIKCPIDSISLENTKISIESADSDSLTAKLIKKDTGTFKVFMYFKSGLIILDKKIQILPFDYKEPSADNIIFTPDTIKLTEENSDIKIIFKGTDFYKYKIDSIIINDIPLYISFKTKDSLITYSTKLFTGTFDVNLFYNGKKITLNKKLVIINTLLDFDLSKFTKFTYEIANIPSRDYYYSLERHRGQGEPYFYYSDILYSNTTNEPILLSKPIMDNQFKYHFSLPRNNELTIHHYLYLQFSKTKNLLESIGYIYDIYSFSEIYYKIENIPYSIVKNKNGTIEMVIYFQGKEIDNHYPLIYTYLASHYLAGGTSRETEEYFVSKKDSLTGKEINYYPANADSRIKFVLN